MDAETWLDTWLERGTYEDLNQYARPIKNLFEQLTGRPGSVDELDDWFDAIKSGASSFDDLREYLEGTPLGQVTARLRAAGYAGPYYWHQQAVLQGEDVDSVVRRVLAAEMKSASDPYQTRLKAAGDALSNLTVSLFGMDPTGAQDQAYIERLANGQITIEQVAAELTQAAALENQPVAVGFGQVDDASLREAMQAAQAAQDAEMMRSEALAQAALEFERGVAARAYAVEVRADVVDVYRQMLKREPAAFEVDYWADLIVSGSIDEELLAVRLSQSTEALILGAYQQNLYRDPNLEERRYWCDAVEIHGLPIDQALANIANSPEAQQYHETIVPTPGASELIVQTINPLTGSAQAIDPIMGTSTWGTSYTNQDMIAADPVASPVVELQNYYNPVVNIESLEPVSPLGDTSAALAFKARDEIYKAYTMSLKREPSEADYQYWEPQLVNKALSLDDFKRYVATSSEALAIISRANDVSLTTTTPEGVQDAQKKTEGVGAAFGLLSAIAFFLGQ
jgi:hypothetical protein